MTTPKPKPLCPICSLTVPTYALPGHMDFFHRPERPWPNLKTPLTTLEWVDHINNRYALAEDSAPKWAERLIRKGLTPCPPN